MNCGSNGTVRFNSDGTYTGRTGSDHQLYMEQWEECRIGTRPPQVRGRWIIYEESFLCLWEDIVPGIFACSDDIYDISLDSSGEIITAFTVGEHKLYDEDGNLINVTYETVTCKLTED